MPPADELERAARRLLAAQRPVLLGEFEQLSPPEVPHEQWRAELQDLANRFTEGCRKVDPTSTDKALEEAKAEVQM